MTALANCGKENRIFMSQMENLINEVPTPEETELLDRELEDYRGNSEAGSTWEEVVARIRKPLYS
jgi:hypothetical protein